jgi:MATE family multidrug resistance protein
VAAMGTLIQITTLLYILPSSLSMGVSARVGKAWLSMIVKIACAVVMSFIAIFFSLR